MKFKKTLLLVLVSVFLLTFISSNAFAKKSRKDYFLFPQVGFWFGPVTPAYTTADLVDSAIGGGIYFRYNLPWRSLKLGFDTSYQHFESKGVNELYTVPLYGNLVYLLPINLPVKIQVKGGVGGCYVYAEPDAVGQWDPLFMTGVEISFPAGRIVNIGLRIDYLYLYEGYADNHEKSGHIINTGITLYFNLNL